MMNGFTFFRNYYEGVSKLSPEDRLQIYDAIMAYMFDDTEPELDGTLGVIFDFVRPNLDTSKKRSVSGSISDDSNKTKQKKSKRNQKKSNETSRLHEEEVEVEEEKEDDKTPLNPPKGKTTTKTVTSMIDDRGFSPDLRDAVMDWMKYKRERREGYVETGLTKFLTQVANNASEYGDAAVIGAMNRTMSQGYVGVVWDWVKEEAKNARDKPAEGWGQLYDPYKEWRNDWKGSEGLTVRDGDFERLVIDD